MDPVDLMSLGHVIMPELTDENIENMAKGWGVDRQPNESTDSLIARVTAVRTEIERKAKEPPTREEIDEYLRTPMGQYDLAYYYDQLPVMWDRLKFLYPVPVEYFEKQEAKARLERK